MSISTINNCQNLQLTQVNHPSFKSEVVSTPNLKSDTVEISPENKKKKEGMSDGLKLLLGIGGGGLALYGALVTHRAVTKPSLEALQKDFKEIFRRDVSIDEVPEMLKKYQEILKIKDEKEFCQKAFEQVKKDYGYGDLNINLALDESTGGVLGGGWHSSGQDFRIFYKNIIKHHNDIFNRQTRASILGTFFHEFQHVKQTEYCVRTDLEKYVQAIKRDDVINQNYINGIEQILKDNAKLYLLASQKHLTTAEVITKLNQELNILRTQGYKAMPDYVAEIDKQINTIRTRLNELFGKYEKFKPESEEYKLGEKYTNNYGNYIEAQKDSANEEYRAQPIEKEAFNVEELSRDIPKRLRSIWKVFSF